MGRERSRSQVIEKMKEQHKRNSQKTIMLKFKLEKYQIENSILVLSNHPHLFCGKKPKNKNQTQQQNIQ